MVYHSLPVGCPRGATNKVLEPLLISRLARVFSLGVTCLCQIGAAWMNFGEMCLRLTEGYLH